MIEVIVMTTNGFNDGKKKKKKTLDDKKTECFRVLVSVLTYGLVRAGQSVLFQRLQFGTLKHEDKQSS